MWRRFLFFLYLVLFLASPAAHARGGLLLLQLNTIQLTQLSEHILDVRCLDVVRVKDQENRWVDRVTVKVQDVLKGNYRIGDRLTFQQLASLPGSVIEGMMPEFVRGEEYLIFSAGSLEDGYAATVGLKQGAFVKYEGADGVQVLRNGYGNEGLLESPARQTLVKAQSLYSAEDHRELSYDSFTSLVRSLLP